jgi:uncharacterized phage protein (TIGR02218 family)
VKPASPALIALLGSSTGFIMADLYTFTLPGGPTYLFSGAATAITDVTTSRTFALGPRFERSTTKTVIGIQSDELDVRIYPLATDMLGATPWAEAAWQGQLDGATVQLERAFMPAYGVTTPGTVVLFAGRVSDIEASRTMISMKVRSHLELLNIEMPRRLWQPSCNHNFGDAMCGYDRVNGKNAQGTPTGIGALTFACAAGSTIASVNGAPVTSNPYALGTITGLSGANAGQSRAIASFVSGGAIGVTLAFLSTPAAGDQFQILPGCDRSIQTCGAVFQNTRVVFSGASFAAYNPANAETFGGMPFVPPPEDAI